jgi:arylsulfatase A-like enzyme
MRRRLLARLAVILCAAALALPGPGRAADLEGVPRYAHIFVIVEENKDYAQILDPASAPHIAKLAKTYGNATQFFGEVHPSEANYVALLGGDTFGIHDDDAYYCKPLDARPYCWGARQPGYVDHTVHARHLGDQLAAAGLSWKGYYETIPQPGSPAVFAGDPHFAPGGAALQLYASKHSGFMNFADVQAAPDRAQHIVGFDQLDRDLASGELPSFALIIPNQCNEMHGLPAAPGLPADCDNKNPAGLIRRGDAHVGELVRKLQATAARKGAENMAIIVSFDEGTGGTREGCCGVTPEAPSNFGGGHIPTIVITNHGPRGVQDARPYNHYSLLRTIEDAFGVEEHLRHADETDKGVRPMRKLFATAR